MNSSLHETLTYIPKLLPGSNIFCDAGNLTEKLFFLSLKYGIFQNYTALKSTTDNIEALDSNGFKFKMPQIPPFQMDKELVFVPGRLYGNEVLSNDMIFFRKAIIVNFRCF